MMWRYDLEYPGMENEWETGFESEDDAYNAMSARMEEIINDIAERHPEMSDEEIEGKFEWSTREE